MPDRTVQDEEITGMIHFLQVSGWGHLVVADLCAMLNELLLLRKKVRKDA